jgi:broad specificity phosphatase PhoE
MTQPVTVVHLLRHGEVHNPDGVLYGRLPGFALSQLGVAQARLAAEWLAGRPIRHIVTSPLERARQTAQPLVETVHVEPDVDERLTEAANFLQGRPVAGGRNLFRDPANWKYFRNPFRPSWGEPYRHVAERVLAAVRSARDAARAHGDGAEAVAVSHQLPIVIARRAAEGRPLFHDPRKRECALASVTSLHFSGEMIVRIEYHEPAATLPAGHGAGA